MKHPPKVDVMVIEGTMLGPRSHEAHPTEKQLEEEILRVNNETAGIVLVTAASQNIDRLVTIYKAAKRAKRRSHRLLHRRDIGKTREIRTSAATLLARRPRLLPARLASFFEGR